jgi:hypothetical protein
MRSGKMNVKRSYKEYYAVLWCGSLQLQALKKTCKRKSGKYAHGN